MSVKNINYKQLLFEIFLHKRHCFAVRNKIKGNFCVDFSKLIKKDISMQVY